MAREQQIQQTSSRAPASAVSSGDFPIPQKEKEALSFKGNLIKSEVKSLHSCISNAF